MALPSHLRSQLSLPAICAPMFLVSNVDLAVATCRAGLIGTLTRNHCRDQREFQTQLEDASARLRQLRETSSGPVGPLAVNISLHDSPEVMRENAQLCHRYGVGIIITAAGDPRTMVDIVHGWGGLVFHDCTSIRFAEKAIAAGVDGIVAIGAGGGGHSGHISHLALIPQIRAIFDGVLIMAGAVGHGAAIRAAEVLGADLAYLGTRFIATQESAAPLDYKRMLVDAESADILYTDAINGLPASWLMPSLREAGLDPRQLPVASGRGTGHLPPNVKPWKNLWSAGHGVGLIHDIPTVGQLVAQLRAQYEAACARPSMCGPSASPVPLQ